MTNKQQTVNKLGQGRFQVFWEGVQNSTLYMDFRPIINTFSLKGNFVLLHWQALPKYLRRWGFYYSPNDMYYPCNYDQLLVQADIALQTLQIDEAKYSTKPTAVILLQPVILETEANEYRLKRQ